MEERRLSGGPRPNAQRGEVRIFASAADLTRAALTEAAAGRLRPVTGQRFPLADAAAAHAAIESRSTIGKTLLVVHQ